jgi:cell division protein ZapE
MSVTTAAQPISFEKAGFTPDPAQLKVIERLQQLHQALVTERPSPGLLQRMLKRTPDPIRGLYIWGGVGRGKTHLMDHFYEAVPITEKQRVHFHRFMQEIHAELKTLPKTPDPLEVIAKRLAGKVRLLCLDEFHVNDIGDAMLLAGFLKTLFENGVTLVTTSNIPAGELYKNGLQRERFLPAIDLIRQYTQELHLRGELDYRSELLERTGTFHLNSNENATALLKEQFNSLAPNNITMAAKLPINQRNIDTIAVSDDVAWFDFPALCETPRSAADYIEIASEYHAIIISDVPQMSEAKDDVAQRFIHLIDALYDHSVKTIISAAARPAEIYTGRRHAFAFQRTASRLQEMASEQYLSKAHRS